MIQDRFLLATAKERRNREGVSQASAENQRRRQFEAERSEHAKVEETLNRQTGHDVAADDSFLAGVDSSSEASAMVLDKPAGYEIFRRKAKQ